MTTELIKRLRYMREFGGRDYACMDEAADALEEQYNVIKQLTDNGVAGFKSLLAKKEELEKERDAANEKYDRLKSNARSVQEATSAAWREDIAAAQLVIQQMQEDVAEGMEHVEAITCDADGNVCLLGSDELRADKYHLQDGIDIIRKSISLQPTTSALDAYVAEKVKELNAEIRQRNDTAFETHNQVKQLREQLAAQAEAMKQLEEWQQLAFAAHPNIDLDIAAINALEK